MGVLDEFSPEVRALVTDESKLPAYVAASRTLRIQKGSAADDAEKLALMEYAVTTGDAALAERLLATGVDPNAVIAFEDPALAIAAQNGHLDVARALIAAGADVNRPGRTGTPLKYAAKQQKHEMVNLLREAGAGSSSSVPTPPPEVVLSLEAGAGFEQAVAAVDLALGTPRRVRVGSAEHAVGLLASEWQTNQVIAEHHDALLRAGCFAFHYADSMGGGCLALLPATDPLEAVAAVGTAGPNWRVTNDALLAWLRATMAQHPLRLMTIGDDKLEARLLKPVGDPVRLAKSIIDICPTWNDDGIENLVDLISEQRRISLWWD